jgi:hypothetical protein
VQAAPARTILKVRYFTTIVAGEPEAARRQETYLAALTTLRPQIEVVRGKFKTKRFRCFGCGQRYSRLRAMATSRSWSQPTPT